MTGDELTDKLQTSVLQLEQQVRDLQARLSGVYTERNRCVALAARMALLLGYSAGIGRPSDASEDWAECVYIDLPTGQASWHFHRCERWLFDDLPHYGTPWDGHSTDEKYRRVERAFPAGRVFNPIEDLVRKIDRDGSVREISMQTLAASIGDGRDSTRRRLGKELCRQGWRPQLRRLADGRRALVYVRPLGGAPAGDEVRGQLGKDGA